MPIEEVPSDSDEEETRRPRIPRYGDDDYEEDPVIKAQQERSMAERTKIVKDFETKLFVPERAAEARKYANELFQQEKFEEAAEAYMRVLKLVPASQPAERAKVYGNMAAVRIKQWRRKDAIEMCSQVLQLEPENAKALYRKGQALQALGRLGEAEAVFVAVAERDPTSREASERLAEVRATRGRP